MAVVLADNQILAAILVPVDHLWAGSTSGAVGNGDVAPGCCEVGTRREDRRCIGARVEEKHNLAAGELPDDEVLCPVVVPVGHGRRRHYADRQGRCTGLEVDTGLEFGCRPEG